MKADDAFKQEFDAIFKGPDEMRSECIRLHPRLQDSHFVLQRERDALWAR